MLSEKDKATFRIIAIGDSSVGKTCLINKFLRGTFDPNESNTVGAFYDSYTEVRNDQIIEIQLWDTAGQEQYRSLGPVYFRGAAGAIVVFDLTNRDSFNSLGDWIRAFKSVSGENSILILAGNKSDLIEQRSILPAEVKKWASENGCTYVETSAKTGEGVSVLFDELMTTLVHANADAFQKKPLSLEAREKGEKGCC